MRKKIMICDDSAFMRMMLKDLLDRDGYGVVCEAKDGTEAVALYRETKPDVLLMDITMPVMDGLEAAKAIIAEDKDAKIIMLSAMGQQNTVDSCMKAGACGFVVKPFRPENITAAIENALQDK